MFIFAQGSRVVQYGYRHDDASYCWLFSRNSLPTNVVNTV